MTSILAAIAVLICWTADAMAASSTTVAPVLVPYTVTAIAGNNQSSIPGYGGDGQPGLAATLNGPNALAVDSVGNVYIADQSNALIREWNAQTGVLKIIAGVPPSTCTGTTCTTTSPGCADGVPALGSAVGAKVLGMVIDGNGNLYFSDYNYQGVWVIYRGGARVASFISLVDSAGVTTAGGVKPGYVYHIAGNSVAKTGGGCSGTSGTTDQVLATQGAFHDPLQMGIDAAGNLFVQDYANDVVRVINTQSTSQTFFGVTVKPGYVAGVVGCNKLFTQACPASNPAFGGPAGGALYSSVLVGMTTDQYGNVYELDGKGANGGIYGGVAYNAGNALAHLINIESGLTATSGSWYEVINSLTSTNGPTVAVQAVPANGSNDIVLRPSSIAVDPLGNLYMLDYHWQSIYRIDANSGMATRINGVTSSIGGTGTPATVAGTNAAPTYCNGTSGPQATDQYGDGCGIVQAKFNSGGTGYVTFDGAGNLYVSDMGNNIVRKISVGTSFPATSMGGSTSQILQFHFDQGNLPALTGTAPSQTTTAFQVATGAMDFSIASTTCANYTLALDNSIECYVTVTFTPTSTGSRGASLQVTTPNGTYPFAITGFGNGSQIVVDGGAPTHLAATGLGQATAVATDPAGNVYVADPTNNQVVLLPAGGKQTTIGTGLSKPMGVAADATGDVFISDSGNNRILKVSALSGTQTVLTTNVSNPHGLAVDTMGNVYVADTGNARVVEIPAFGELGPTPLLGYTGAQTFVNPVGVAIDKAGNVYVADTGITTGVVKFTAGAGDLQPAIGSTSVASSTSVVSFGTAFIKAPSGIAIDGAGDLYVSDGSGNAVVEIPSATGPGSEPFNLNFPGLNGPTGLAIDGSNNLYVADTGNNQVLLDSRTNLSLNFGNVYLHQTPGSIPLTVTNVGTTPYTPVSPFIAIAGANASDFSETDTCSASNFPLGALAAGLHCGVTAVFTPTATGSRSASMSVEGGIANVSLVGVGFLPQALLTLSASAPGGLVANQTATITLTVTQPAASNTPSGGQVTFSYTVNGVATTLPPVTLPTSGIVTFNLPTLLLGRQYVVNASYSGDNLDSPSTASPLSFYVPGTPLTVTAASLTYVYGSPVPQVTGTVSGILPADQGTVTYKFSTTATPSSPVGSYPIVVTFSGGNYQNYGFPQVLNADGKTPAVVTETKAPLTLAVENVTVPYGLPSVTFVTDATGLVNNDVQLLKETYVPALSQPLDVGTYTVVPTPTILDTTTNYDRIKNYAVTIKNGTLVITQNGSLLTINQVAKAVLPTALASGAFTIVATPATAGYYGTPTGTVTITDTFTPLSATGAGTSVTEPAIVLKLSGGKATYTPTDPTIGTHSYQFAYSGDLDFEPYSTVTATSLIVDVADFTVTSTTTPIQVAPGIIPGGVATATGEQAATPEIANVYIAPVLGSTAVVNLTCAVPVAYITCTLTPSTITLNGTATQISVVAVSTPATLPVNYTAQLRRNEKTVMFAVATPIALLMLLPFFGKRRRLQATRLLMLMVALLALVNVTGCGGNLVKFFTPVPAGPTQVTVTGTSGSVSRSFVISVSIQ